jgi:hypothetical protein
MNIRGAKKQHETDNTSTWDNTFSNFQIFNRDKRGEAQCRAMYSHGQTFQGTLNIHTQ